MENMENMDFSMLAALGPSVLSAGVKLLWSLVFLAIGLKVISVLRSILRKALERSALDIGVVQFLDALVKIGAYAILVMIMLDRFGIQTTSFVALLGSAGVAIGLSLQGSLGNFAGGILILMLKPFKVEDFIEAGGYTGTVSEISLFATTLHTADNRNVVIPNGSLANGNIVNYSANETRRVDMTVGVAYGTDLKKARQVIKEILEEDERILKDPEYTVAVDDLADSSITILVRPWVKSEDYWSVKWDTMEKIYDCLNRENIEIPFPQMTVHLDK